MSILIKTMEMPENGWKHIMLTSDGKAYRFEDFTAGTTATKYEAVEVPLHGRLIDANALTYVMGMDEHFSPLEAMYLMGLVADAPTIIPAEESE